MHRYIGILFMVAILCGCATTKEPETVYICTGFTGDAYHANPDCRGLKNCDGELGVVTVADALEIGLHPCPICEPKDTIESFEKKHPGVIK